MKKLLAIGAGLIASLALTFNANATWYPLLASTVTNYIVGVGGGSNLVGWPSLIANTNGTGYNQTNGYGPTGAGYNIQAADAIGIDVQGFMVYPTALAGTNGSITLMLITSDTAGVPNTIVATNALSAGQVVTNSNDWATNNAITLVFTPQAGVQTNWVHYMTNVSTPSIPQQAAWIGVYQIQNNLGSTGYITNFSVAVSAKTPVRPISN